MDQYNNKGDKNGRKNYEHVEGVGLQWGRNFFDVGPTFRKIRCDLGRLGFLLSDYSVAVVLVWIYRHVIL